MRSVSNSEDLPAVVAPISTTVIATQGVAIVAPVARFSSDDPLSKPADFSAAVDFGDGTSAIGKIRAAAGGGFEVVASHTYAATSPGFPIKVTIAPTAGASVDVASKAIVVPASSSPSSSVSPFVGRLAPESDTGISNSDGITNARQPTFVGTTDPRALVLIYGKRTDASRSRLLGRVVAGGDGAWSLTVGALTDGAYLITATETLKDGTPRTSMLYGPISPLVIDTVAPRVSGLAYAPNRMTALVVITDNTSGVVRRQVEDKSKYSVAGTDRNAIAVEQLRTAAFDGQSYAIQLTLPRKLRTSKARLALIINGVSDVAGNILYGQFFSQSVPPAFRAYRRPVLGVLGIPKS